MEKHPEGGDKEENREGDREGRNKGEGTGDKGQGTRNKGQGTGDKEKGENDKGDRMMEQKVYEMSAGFSKGYEIANETSKTLIIKELCLIVSKICSIA